MNLCLPKHSATTFNVPCPAGDRKTMTTSLGLCPESRQGLWRPLDPVSGRVLLVPTAITPVFDPALLFSKSRKIRQWDNSLRASRLQNVCNGVLERPGTCFKMLPRLGMGYHVLERPGTSWNLLPRLGTSWHVLEPRPYIAGCADERWITRAVTQKFVPTSIEYSQ